MGSIDRLSELPDSLLVHILSFVSPDSDINVRDAARTSVLSKRWRYLWCELTRLKLFHFDSYDFVEISKFVAMVDKILLSRTATLEEFNVDLAYNEAWASHVDSWVDLALKLKSKILLLSLPPDNSIQYSLPELLYSNSVLTELSLYSCTVDPWRRVDWKSMTTLRITFVELQQCVVENILSGCPALCNLVLHSCWGFNSLKIDYQHLRELSLIDRYEGRREDNALLEISAPYLRILNVDICFKRRKVWLKNISAVVQVKVNTTPIYRRKSAYVINAVKELFEEIQHVKQLHMRTNFFQFVIKIIADGQQLQQQSRRLSLKIDNLFKDHITSGVLEVLESCPKLETLQLHEVRKEPPQSPPLWMSDDLNCDLLHLKMVGMKITVRINEMISVESCPMLMLIRILLRRAVALEKMEIRFEILNRDMMIKDRERFEKVFEEVLSWPKSSPPLFLVQILGYRNWY